MNLEIYNKVRQVPKEAQKPIAAGRLKGKTDINPMWRIKALTEQFGVCGFGWKYEIVQERLESTPTEEIASFVKINLYVKMNGEWSDPIPGTGGSSFVANESKGLYVSDECFKMALTDAISVSCKALGFGADIYWQGDNTKYNKQPSETKQSTSTGQSTQAENVELVTSTEIAELTITATQKGVPTATLIKMIKKQGYNKIEEITKHYFDGMYKWLSELPDKEV